MYKKIYLYNNYNVSERTITGTIKEPIVYSDTLPDTDYTEQTTIQNIYNVTSVYVKDNILKQDLLRQALSATTWSSLTNSEKDIVIEMSIGDLDTEKVTYLLSNGYTQAQAVSILRNNWGLNLNKNRRACEKRLKSLKISDVLGIYLTIQDAEDLQTTIRDLEDDYLMGMRGVAHHGETYGLVDYFNSTTGTTGETQGLRQTKSYVMQNGDANMDNFVNDVLDVLIYGNY